MQSAGAIGAFLLLFGSLVGLMIVAAECAEPDGASADAQAFFSEYQRRAPSAYDSGRIDFTIEQVREVTFTRLVFDDHPPRLYEHTEVNGVMKRERVFPPQGAEVEVFPGFVAAEIRIGSVNAPALGGVSASRQPDSVRFREDPKVAAAGTRQLILKFTSKTPGVSDVTQLLTIDARTYELLLAETTWSEWDFENDRWRVRHSRTLSQIDEPQQIPAAVVD